MSEPSKEISWITTALPGKPDGNGHVYLVEKGGRKLASIWGPADLKVANANLFSAAPAMRDALQYVLDNASLSGDQVHRVAGAIKIADEGPHGD